MSNVIEVQPEEVQELVLVNPTEYGIEKPKAIEILGNLPQLKTERFKLEQEYNDVLTLDIEDKKTAKVARELRLKIRDNRTKGIDKWHKDAKDLFLRGGQFVDAIKRVESEVNISMESKLEQIEKYAEVQEAKRKELLRVERVAQLEVFKDFVPMGLNFGEMAEDEFQKIQNGAKLQHEAKVKADAEEAERKRIEAEKSELARIEEKKRIQAQEEENNRLREEAEKKEQELAEERAKAEQERLKAEEENRRIRDEKDAQLKAEREKAEALQAEIRAKAEQERLKAEELLKANQLKVKEAEKLAKAPIKKQMTAWINTFEIPQTSIENDKVKSIQEKFEAFKAWALKEADSI